MCIRCNDCGWLGETNEMVKISSDPSPRGVSLPAGNYVELFCPECGADDYEEGFDLADQIDIDYADEYEAEVRAFNDTLRLGFSRSGRIESISTDSGTWIFARKGEV